MWPRVCKVAEAAEDKTNDEETRLRRDGDTNFRGRVPVVCVGKDRMLNKAPSLVAMTELTTSELSTLFVSAKTVY